ncbi:MAG TPA: ATP-binding protein, partial [Polyangia bacterium]
MEAHPSPLPRPYPTPAAAVAAEVARLAIVVRRALRRLRPDERRHADADRVLSRLEHPADRAPETVDAEAERLTARLAERQKELARDRAATTIALPLYALAERGRLSPLAFDLFLLALAPEVDEDFARVYQLVRGVQKRGLDVATAARILVPSEPAAASLRQTLAPGAALYELGLVELSAGEGGGGEACTMQTTLTVPPSVVAHVLGQEVHEPRLRGLIVEPAERTFIPPERTFIPEELFRHVTALTEDREALPLLEGPAGGGKRLLVRALAAGQKRALVELDLRNEHSFRSAEAVAAARLAWLADAWILVALPPPATGDEGPRPARTWQTGVSDLLARFPGRVLLSRDTNDPAHLDLGVATTRRLSPVQLPAPDRDTREKLWRDRLGTTAAGGDVDFALLARTYPVTGGVITRIAGEARTLARAQGRAEVAQADVMAAVDAAFRPILSTVGRRLSTRATHADLIISDETKETLEELEATIRLRDRVLDEWDFKKLVRGRGVSALFYGDPGTGKTMAAGVIAAASGLPLYIIDTASLVSKWVGETEKNLGEVFRAAEAGHAMLLFDEADAIFGKRTDVQNSTDRYANMQTNFLLTSIEMFNGVSILTTNRESVMDQAFQRRLTFRVHFPMPDEREREKLWRKMLEGHAAAADEIAVGELARRLERSGGYIRNAVLRAGYLAA